MKIIFIINDSSSVMLEYEHTGILNSPGRRAVVIELTEDQIKQLNIQKIGVSYGNALFETIESVSLDITP